MLGFNLLRYLICVMHALFQVLVTDADVLYNAASKEELVNALLPFATRIRSGEVIFSAEGPCVTVNVAYRKDLCAAFMRRASDATNGQPRLTALNRY